jgi:hypothetical protein
VGSRVAVDVGTGVKVGLGVTFRNVGETVGEGLPLTTWDASSAFSKRLASSTMVSPEKIKVTAQQERRNRVTTVPASTALPRPPRRSQERAEALHQDTASFCRSS